jgi:hypothetical protein
MLILNLTLLASVMTEGAHYGVDMLGGLVVAWVAVAASRSILAWCAFNRIVMPLPRLVRSAEVLVAYTPRSGFPVGDRR